MNFTLNSFIFIICALAAGMMIPTQGAVNSRLAVYVENPLLSAFISFAVGTIALFFCALFAGAPLGNLILAKNAPLVLWIGGLLGAFFVTTAILAVPRLGVAVTFSLMIAGQMAMTLILDQFGLFDLPVKEINPARIIGALLIVAGVILIRRF